MINSINSTKYFSKRIIALISIFLITTLYSTVYAASPVVLSIDSDWGGGFGGNIVITNDTSTQFDSWEVEFDFPHGITSIWNASIDSRSGNHYIIKNVSWNGSLAPGASVSFGFNGSPGNVDLSTFTNVKLNGISIDNPGPEPGPGNSVPIANNDSAFTATNTTVSINVLANDSDPDNDPLSISTISVAPANGSAVINGSSVEYTP
ncbi:MAG: hypothetical protein GY775_20700, partial [Candidatus Scalindua sp.]|nr:hypothetical protein [Candidatus Scalindua sp.]